eukprot:109660_1
MSVDQGKHEETVNLPLILLARHRKKHYNIITDPQAIHKRPLQTAKSRNDNISLKQIRLKEDANICLEEKENEININISQPNSLLNWQPSNGSVNKDSDDPIQVVLSQSDKCHEILQSYFNFNSFQQSQLEIIISAINGHDTFVGMPTGSGKSLCYIMPSLYLKIPTLIVSPLKSLIEDQTRKLSNLGILCINLKSANILQLIENRKCLHIFATPETLKSTNNKNIIKQIYQKYGLLFAVDEAQCIVMWRDEFRPEYGKLHELRKLCPNSAMMALTATVTRKSQQHIIKALQLGSKHQLVSVTKSSNRENLFVEIKAKRGILIDLCGNSNKQYYTEGSTIIYCCTKETCLQVASTFRTCNMKHFGVYHAGMTDQDRLKVQLKWQNDEIQCIISTSALGMGIDKKNVRFVIHWGPTFTIEDYWQQCGRAGRDKIDSKCIMFFMDIDFNQLEQICSQPKQKRQKTSNNMDGMQMQPHKNITKSQSIEIVRQLINTPHCRKKYILSQFGETVGPCITKCDNCVRANSEPVIEMKENNNGDIDVRSMDVDEQQKKPLKCIPKTLIVPNKEIKSIHDIIPITVPIDALTDELTQRILTLNNAQNAKEPSEQELEHFTLNVQELNEIVITTFYQFNHLTKKGTILIKKETSFDDAQKQNISLVLPSLTNVESNTNVNRQKFKSQGLLGLDADTFAHSGLIAMPSYDFVQQLINVNNDSIIDWEYLQRVQDETNRNKNQKDLIDKTIKDFETTLSPVEWTKHNRKLQKDITRWISITITKTPNWIKGSWKEIRKPREYNITKSWLLELKVHLLKLILNHFFGVRVDDGTTKLQILNILYKKMAFTAQTVSVIGVIMSQINKICQRLLHLKQFEIITINHEAILKDEIMSMKEMPFLHIYEQLETDEVFRNLIYQIWMFLLSGIAQSKNISQFNEIYRAMLNNWDGENKYLLGEYWKTVIDKNIQTIENIYNTKWSNSLYDYKAFMSGCMTIIKQGFIEQMRTIIIGDVCNTFKYDSTVLTRTFLFNIAGTALLTAHRYFERFKKGLLVPAVNKLSSSNPNDIRYPERYRNERMSNWKVITLHFEHGIGLSLRQLNREMGLLLKLDLSPDFSILFERIVQRVDIYKEFETLFVGYEVKKLFNRNLTKEYENLTQELGVENLSKEYILARVYKILMNSILSKATNKNIKDKDYTKLFIPLRVQEKIKSMQEKNRIKPLGK